MSCCDRCLRGNPPPTDERMDGTTSTPTTVAPTERDRTRRTVASKTQDTDSFPPQPQANTVLVITTATAGQSIARLQARVQTLQQELQLLKSQGHDVIPQRAVHDDTLATSQRATRLDGSGRRCVHVCLATDGSQCVRVV